MTIVTPPPEISRDRYGRPLVVPPGGGKPVAYTRATTYIDCLEDKFNLQRWMQRMVALGLAARPDLLLSVSAHKDDKRELDKITDAAKEAAAATAKATTGTALHALTELVDRGQDVPVLPPNAKASLDAYAAATGDLKATLIEQFCVLDTLKIGGTPDRVVEFDGARYIADIKTGSIEYGALKIAMQLAIYARSYTYDIATGERGRHDAETTRGIIIHLPSVDDPADATCELLWVDLEAGWHAVSIAGQVREQRKLKFGQLTAPFGPVTRVAPGSVEGNTSIRRERAAGQQAATDATAPLVAKIHACATAEEVRAVWAAHEHEWSDDLTKTAREHIASLPAAV